MAAKKNSLVAELHKNTQLFGCFAAANVTWRVAWHPSCFLITLASVWPAPPLEEGQDSAALAYGLIDDLGEPIWRWWRYTSSQTWIPAIKQVNAVIKVAVSFQAIWGPLIMADESTLIKLLVVRNQDEWFPDKRPSTGGKVTTASQWLQSQKRMRSVLTGHHRGSATVGTGSGVRGQVRGLGHEFCQWESS